MHDVPEHVDEIGTELGALAYNLRKVGMGPQAKEVHDMRVRLELIAMSYKALTGTQQTWVE